MREKPKVPPPQFQIGDTVANARDFAVDEPGGRFTALPGTAWRVEKVHESDSNGIPHRYDIAAVGMGGIVLTRKESELYLLTKAKKKQPMPAPSPQDADAPNPYADLLDDIRRLAGRITAAVKDESVHGQRLHAYLGVCGLLTHEDVGQKSATLVALRGVYAVVRAAGEPGKPKSEKAVKAIYDRASGGWVPPLIVRQRQRRTNGVPREYDL